MVGYLVFFFLCVDDWNRNRQSSKMTLLVSKSGLIGGSCLAFVQIGVRLSREIKGTILRFLYFFFFPYKFNHDGPTASTTTSVVHKSLTRKDPWLFAFWPYESSRTLAVIGNKIIIVIIIIIFRVRVNCGQRHSKYFSFRFNRVISLKRGNLF